MLTINNKFELQYYQKGVWIKISQYSEDMTVKELITICESKSKNFRLYDLEHSNNLKDTTFNLRYCANKINK